MRAETKQRTAQEDPAIATLYRVMDSFEAMSDQELFEFSVRAGIYRSDGRLTAAYGGTDDEPSSAAA